MGLIMVDMSFSWKNEAFDDDDYDEDDELFL